MHSLENVVDCLTEEVLPLAPPFLESLGREVGSPPLKDVKGNILEVVVCELELLPHVAPDINYNSALDDFGGRCVLGLGLDGILCGPSWHKGVAIPLKSLSLFPPERLVERLEGLRLPLDVLSEFESECELSTLANVADAQDLCLPTENDIRIVLSEDVDQFCE